MALDPRIILAGQTPDVVNTLQRSSRAAAMTNQNRRQNALSQVYQQHGPGIMQGDPNALNALARQNPAQALGIQQTQRQGQRAGQELQMKVAQYARQVGAQRAQQEAQEIEQGILRATQLYQAGDLGGINALLQSVGEQPLQSLEQFPALAARYKQAADALKTHDDLTAEPAPMSGPGKLKADLDAGRITPEQFNAAMQKSGMRVTTDGQGGFTFEQGPGVAGGEVDLSETQSKDNVFATRARGALEVLEPVADKLTSRTDRGLEYVPFGFGRDYQGDNFQVARQAGDEFLQAILRKDTGAAITEQEQVLYGETYLPQPGDGEAVLGAKRAARARAVAAIESGMSPLQIVMRDQALVNAAEETASRNQGGSQPSAPQGGESMDFGSMTVEQLSQVNVNDLSEAQLDAFIAAMEAAQAGSGGAQ